MTIHGRGEFSSVFRANDDKGRKEVILELNRKMLLGIISAINWRLNFGLWRKQFEKITIQSETSRYPIMCIGGLKLPGQ